MARNTFTEARLESFECMVQTIPGRMREYDNVQKEQHPKKEKLKQRQYHRKWKQYKKRQRYP